MRAKAKGRSEILRFETGGIFTLALDAQSSVCVLDLLCTEAGLLGNDVLLRSYDVSPMQCF